MYNSVWYKSLNTPLLMPPDWIFAPVWIILYLMIFASFWIFLRAESVIKKSLAIIFFSVQLLLNFIWSTVFFTMTDIQGALVVVFFMWLFILFTIIEFHKISKLSAYLLIPYFLWVSFAFYLNLSFYILNK
ncbi:tryptophan-rich sensory protein [bacterium]|nr:tryptophan-rich sensory protein [bacterium]